MATEPKATLKEVLTYWFGVFPAEAEEKEKWRGGLWFRGLDPKIAKAHPTEEGAAIHQRTDKYIADRFGPLFDDEKENIALQHDVDARVAKVVLWDQLARNAFRGTPRAFAYDALAQPLALSILQDPANQEHLEINWNHTLFLCIALMHAEKVEHTQTGLHFLEDTQKKLLCAKKDELANRLRPILKNFLSHLNVILRFGRYPSRNAALGRTSTPEELDYLTTEKLPRWAKSQQPHNNNKDATTPTTDAKSKAVGDDGSPTKKTKPLRLLVLHGNRANLRKFKSRVKDTLKGISSADQPVQLEYIKAPNLYHSQDTEEKRYLEGALDQPEQTMGDNRCWWYMNDQGHHVGLEKSIQAVEDWIEETGPYDGVLGFAQGACMAAVLAALQHGGRLRIQGGHLRFVICISGFYCRDVREEFSTLHASLSSEGDLHTPETVQARSDKVSIPSFHTWGLKDSLIDGWRSEMLSQAFEEPTVEPHPGEHMARGIEHWPVASMRQWLASLQLEEGSGGTEAKDTSPLDSFADKFFAFKKAVQPTGRDVVAINRPLRLHNQERIMADPIWSELPESVSEVSYDQLAVFVPRLLSLGVGDHSQKDGNTLDWKQLVDDAMIAAWCFYPFNAECKWRNCKGWNKSGLAFCWMLRLLFEQVMSEEAHAYLLDFHLPWISRYSDSWESLVRVDMIFTLGTSEKTSDPPPKHILPASEYAASIHSTIAEIFAERLADDFRKVIEAKEAYDALQGTGSLEANDSEALAKMKLYHAPSLPSNCADTAPRRRGTTQRAAKLADLVADALTAKSKEARESFPRGSARNRYRFVLQQIVGFTKEYAAALADTGSSRDLFRMSDRQWDEAFHRPFSAAVLQPTPEPVDIATEEQMAPLHVFLRERPGSLGQTEMTFERGTLLDDGRLDLCKQVIGPQGVKPLFESLMHDDNGLVQHLLLGNNVAGDDLGRAVGEYIRSGQSKLTTWYIAGNRMTKDGITPVCEALCDDSQVLQLWLKRNPLLSISMGPVASLLRSNSYLQVLDLTNTGILDEGCAAVMGALAVNSALEYLYLATNGITRVGVEAIRNYFETTKHKSLKGLGLGCNRIGDEGTKELVEGLKAYGVLKRLDLASCGIGEGGAECLAGLLASPQGAGLRSLDLGAHQSTFAVGEVPNRIKTKGALALARALRSNTSLEALNVSNNDIYNDGFLAFEEALRSNHEKSALRHLVLHQPGIPVNELVLEKIRFYVKAKAVAWQKKRELVQDEDFVDPTHLDDIQSVYRVGAKYDK
ncbi:Esterase OVCA2 [Seminavis robusta]|uniref:Esterase OVCA2 n=1 Tax=Seminavis robusta TaxID=568900 RepID=A0A9N8EMK8_9STRA|nr:Esterase OVCA2 [Seminavis robusta]|eukprot:Sro1550_g281700.1 Esterase OVCA2 (1269) ;mRNA; r:9516-13322